MSHGNPFLAGLLSIVLFSANAAFAQQVWFAPPDNLPRGTRIINEDFPHLFDSSPGWSARTNVFVLAPHYVEAASEAWTWLLSQIGPFILRAISRKATLNRSPQC